MSKRFLFILNRRVLIAIKTVLGKNRSISMWNRLIAGVQRATSKYITYHFRPKFVSDYLLSNTSLVELPQLAIVIQGPIIIKDNFTLETVKLYKKLFPNTLLILSTWEDTPEHEINPFYLHDITIVCNEKPKYAGVSNINLQIETSKKGIIKAKELGAEYVMKTRTDQRMYASNVSQFLFDMINLFPIKSDIIKQNKRIIGVSINTFKYRMYGLSDMLIYGHIDDMLLFWNIPLDMRKFNYDEQKIKNHTLRSFAHSLICEVFLTTEFLKKVDRKLEWTLEDSWKIFADHFCIIDKESLDLYWGKYGTKEYRWTNYNDTINIFEEISFREWINFYCNSKQIKPSEEILDFPIKK